MVCSKKISLRRRCSRNSRDSACALECLLDRLDGPALAGQVLVHPLEQLALGHGFHCATQPRAKDACSAPDVRSYYAG